MNDRKIVFLLYYVGNKDQGSLYIFGTVMAITLYIVLYILYIGDWQQWGGFPLCFCLIYKCSQSTG